MRHIPTSKPSPAGAVKASAGSTKREKIRRLSYFLAKETGFYYLQSRYYDPEIGRFISADCFASTGQGFIGCNMFAYCGNDPVDGYDPSGQIEFELIDNGTVVQIKLENRFDYALFILGNDAQVCADLYLGYFYATLAAGSAVAPPVSAGLAFCAMDSLAKLGVDFSLEVNDIASVQRLMATQGYAYAFLDLIPNPLNAANSRVSDKPKHTQPQNIVSSMTSSERRNHMYDSTIVSQMGITSLYKEVK